jgi:hypothetical protein
MEATVPEEKQQSMKDIKNDGYHDKNNFKNKCKPTGKNIGQESIVECIGFPDSK